MSNSIHLQPEKLKQYRKAARLSISQLAKKLMGMLQFKDAAFPHDMRTYLEWLEEGELSLEWIYDGAVPELAEVLGTTPEKLCGL